MNISPTREAQSVMAALRPPSSRPLRLLYGFSTEVYTNYGYTFEIEAGEAAIAPGKGVVVSTVKRFARYKHTTGRLTGTPSFEVTINHGSGIQTVVAGLQTLAIRGGDTVARGDILGQPSTNEIFFGVRFLTETFSPHELGRHWQMQGEYVPGQAGKLRFAPDKLIRNFAGTVASVVYGGLRYFLDQTNGFKPLLINVDFNGNGSKTGLAALGMTDADYWNVYQPGAFSWTGSVSGCGNLAYYFYAYSCPPTKVFNVSPQTFLKDYSGAKSPVWLERVAAASADSGTLSAWDAMLSTWIGGWVGITPDENFFAIRGLVAGTYRLCLYANTFGRSPASDTMFGAAVDNALPVFKNTTATAATSFQENFNYVKYDLIVPAGSVISVKAYGYFDGLQLERLV